MALYEAPVEIVDLNRGEHELYHAEFIVYRDVGDKAHRAEHPVIIDGLVSDQPDQKLQIGLSSHIEEMSFEDYLSMMGVKYADYIMEKNHPKNDGADPHKLIKQLHQEVINKRTQTAQRLTKNYSRSADSKSGVGATGSVVRQGFTHETQEATATNDSKFFIKLIQDLGIDGFDAQAALPREDLLDEIDEFLVFDKEAYEAEGEEQGNKISIAIQRSFNYKTLTSSVVLLPEETDRGLVVKVFIKEEPEDYQDESDISLYQRLLEARAAKAKQAGMSPLAYAAKHPSTEGLSPIAEVLLGGQTDQVKRVLSILRQVQSQYKKLLDDPSKLRNLSPYWQKRLRENFDNLPIQDIIDELTGN